MQISDDKVIDIINDIQKKVSENTNTLDSIEDHLEQLNSQTYKNKKKIEKIDNVDKVDDIEEDLGKLDDFITLLPYLRAIAIIMVVSLFLQIPMIANNLQGLLEILGVAKFFV